MHSQLQQMASTPENPFTCPDDESLDAYEQLLRTAKHPSNDVQVKLDISFAMRVKKEHFEALWRRLYEMEKPRLEQQFPQVQLVLKPRKGNPRVKVMPRSLSGFSAKGFPQDVKVGGQGRQGQTTAIQFPCGAL